MEHVVNIPPSTQATAMQLATTTNGQCSDRLNAAAQSISMAALMQMFNAGYAAALRDHKIEP
jgi:hypothetical protein